MEELVQGGLGLRGEHGPLLALPRRHHGRVGGGRGDGLRELCLLQPLLQDLFDGGSVGGAQLHLLEAADGALGKVAVAPAGQGLADGALRVAEPDPLGLELLCKGLQLHVLRGHLGGRNGGQGALGGNLTEDPGGVVHGRDDGLTGGRLCLRDVTGTRSRVPIPRRENGCCGDRPGQGKETGGSTVRGEEERRRAGLDGLGSCRGRDEGRGGDDGEKGSEEGLWGEALGAEHVVYDR